LSVWKGKRRNRKKTSKKPRNTIAPLNSIRSEKGGLNVLESMGREQGGKRKRADPGRKERGRPTCGGGIGKGKTERPNLKSSEVNKVNVGGKMGNRGMPQAYLAADRCR